MSARWSVLLLAVAACHAGTTVRIGAEYPPRPGDWPVELLLSGEAPAVLVELLPNHRVGDVPEGASVIGRSVVLVHRATGWEGALAKAPNEARRIGGDGVVIRSGLEPGVDPRKVTGHLSTTVYRYEAADGR